MRVLSVVVDTDKNWFDITGSLAGLRHSQTRGFSPVLSSSHDVGNFLELSSDIFLKDNLRSYFFRSIAKRTKGRVLLN